MREHSTPFPQLVPIRCKRCNTQLASHDQDGLCIRRGNLEATVTGTDFTVAAACYRCRTLNVMTSTSSVNLRPARDAGATPS